MKTSLERYSSLFHGKDSFRNAEEKLHADPSLPHISTSYSSGVRTRVSQVLELLVPPVLVAEKRHPLACSAIQTNSPGMVITRGLAVLERTSCPVREASTRKTMPLKRIAWREAPAVWALSSRPRCAMEEF